jgi:hypothetical protein
LLSNRYELVFWQGAAAGQALAAVDAGPKTAIGKAVVRVCGIETLGEFTLGDVGNEADMGVGSAERVRTIEHAEVAIVPCTTKQGGEMSLGTLDGVEDGGKLFGDGKQAAVCGGLLIAWSRPAAPKRAVVIRELTQG